VRRHDVIVIGGGPGGLFAAARLAERGHDTLLVEEHAEVGRPVHCTGILAREAFPEFGLGTGSILNALSHVRFNSPSGLQVDYDPTGVDAVVVDRAVFDEEIATRAAAAGARILAGQRVTRLASDASGVTVTVNGGETLEGKTAVLACGASYAFQRQLGLRATGAPGVTRWRRGGVLRVADRSGGIRVGGACPARGGAPRPGRPDVRRRRRVLLQPAARTRP
jgi:flavin-dependent dehydrogenase